MRSNPATHGICAGHPEVSPSGSVSGASSQEENQDTAAQNRWQVEMEERRLEPTPLV